MIPATYNPRIIDLEEFHERSEVDIQVIPLNLLTGKRDDKDRISEILAWDDLTSMELDGHNVKEARSEYIEYVKEKQVWDTMPRTHAQARGWNVIKTRWIDINKGDDVNPVYQSRPVGK